MSDTTQRTTQEHAIQVPVGAIKLDGDLAIPARAKGIVLFAHGSGSSRLSPRNRYVANVLHEGGLATLLIDLLTPEEEAIDLETTHLRFDVDMLAQRVIQTTDWLEAQPQTRGLGIGYFGASTGAGAALIAAAERGEKVKAVVSRGGRPDLAKLALNSVRSPTLFIVGGSDTLVIQLNRAAEAQIPGPTRLEIIRGATHLFEEPGALEEVARLARDWFASHLAPVVR